MSAPVDIRKELLSEPVTYGVEPFISESYARAEREKLWGKVWQHACRVEELRNVGDYVTYDILDDTILIVRSEPEKISAFYNVCAHRGRRLMDGCGHATQFRCKYHAWRYNLKGENIHVLDKADWNGALTAERLRLPEVKVDTWGGWVWVNMDPNCEPLRNYLEPAAGMLDPFRAREDALSLANVVLFRLQLENRNRGIHGGLSRRGHSPAAPQTCQLLPLEQSGRKAWSPRLQGARSGVGHIAEQYDHEDRERRGPPGVDCAIAGRNHEDRECQNHADIRRCGGPAGRRIARRNSRRQGHAALARIGAP